MAEALARHLAADVIVASSAGLVPLGFLAPTTREVLAEIGVSCDGQTSKPLREQDIAVADLLINLSGRPLENLFDAPTLVEDWEVADPFGRDLEFYRRTRDQIERRVAKLAERLRAAAAGA
jgi:arsenate reductase (thioredoxin)